LLARPFRIAHAIWAILILLVCVALVAMGGGHPPPAAFVPFVLLGGIAGHILLVLVQWLLRQGRARLAGHPGEAPAWPVELVLIALVLGPLAIMMIAVAVDQFPRVRTHPLEGVLIVGAAALHSAAFVLLLLRVDLARFCVAAICVGWAVAFLLQIREARPGELPVGIALIGALLALAAYVVRAPRIRGALR
jgi:hypothetical protein